MKNPPSQGDLADFHVQLIPAGHDESIHFDCQAQSKDHAVEQALNAYPGALVLFTRRLLALRVTVTTRWAIDPDEQTPDALASAMTRSLQGLCQQEVSRHRNWLPSPEVHVHAKVMPLPVPHRVLAEFMRRRIDSGDLSPEDLPGRLAQYGVMDPAAFVAEMRERIDLESADAADNRAPREPEPMDVATLHPGDLVDLASCPYLHGHPTAAFQYATVVHVEHETAQCVAIGYEGIDTIG